MCDEAEQAKPALCPEDCAPASMPATSASAIVASRKCADGLCDGPENRQNCPDDCTAAGASSGDSASTCPRPNPQRAVVQDLLEWHNWLDDGSFEGGTADVVISEYPGGTLPLGRAERSSAAARTGSYGYALNTESDQGLVLSIRSYVDKGEGVRFAFWARSPAGETSLLPTVTWVERGQEDSHGKPYSPEQAFTIGPA